MLKYHRISYSVIIQIESWPSEGYDGYMNDFEHKQPFSLLSDRQGRAAMSNDVLVILLGRLYYYLQGIDLSIDCPGYGGDPDGEGGQVQQQGNQDKASVWGRAARCVRCRSRRTGDMLAKACARHV